MTKGDSAPCKVVIAGRDAAAWLTANALIRAFGATGLQIEVVELPTLLRPADIYSSLPALEPFHNLLGFDENEVLRACAGVYSLGQSFVNFSGNRPPFFHPYGGHGAPIGRLPFMQYWIKARQQGMKAELEDFSINAAAAKHGKFFIPTEELRSLGGSDYAYHLQAMPYVAYLRAKALHGGAIVYPARAFDVIRDQDSDRITELRLADGRSIKGDVFVDATGAESLLLAAAKKSAFESWSAWYPFSRVLSYPATALPILPVYSQVRALKQGCLHLSSTQHMLNVMHVFDPSGQSDDEALNAAAIVSNLRPKGDEATVGDLRPGRRSAPWVGNCIAIGEAAVVFDPIDNVGLQAILTGLAHLITLFPVSADSRLEREEYNRNLGLAFDHIRDFQFTHYRLNRLFDQPTWDRVREADVSERLAARLELFQARGRVPVFDEETFSESSWEAIFTGHGLMPRSYDPVVDQTPDDVAIRHVQNMLGFIRQQVETMTDMRGHLAQSGARISA